MVCTNCGSENKPNRRFCRECGTPLNRECAECGATNDAEDNFCGRCGARLADVVSADDADDDTPEREPHERRFVVVLFADLVGFTSFSAARDPEVVRTALTGYFDRARDIVTGFGGVIEKFIGDAVMAVWGATVSHEDDAERAVRAGLELVSMVTRLGEDLGGDGLSLRVGVLSGEASVAPASPEQGFVVGDLVNTASRLQSIAEPGSVVTGEATYRMLQRAVEFEPLGERQLKGKADPVAVWRAVRVTMDRSQRERSGGVEPDFVGRDAELRLLKDAFHAVDREGRTRLVSIVGEAGIGKTRLAWELRKYVGGLAHDTYWHDGRSPAYDQGLALWALAEMVRQRAGIAETDDPLRSRTKLRTAVAEYVPLENQEWIEPRLAALLSLDTAPSDDRAEFFAAVRSFFEAIARRGTTVLVFEDFHWADEGLIEFVSELVERSTRYPILVLTLARPDLLDRAPGWGAGRRNFASVHLGPLNDAEMSAIVVGMVQGAEASLVAAITERANGIPLYAVEVVRMLIADGDLVMGDGVCCVPAHDLSTIRVPDTVRAVIEARLDRLPARTRSSLQDCAVMGAAFTRAGIAAMVGLDGSELDDLLATLVHRELLEFESDPRSPERGQYRFMQSMIREVAYGRLTREERRVRHIRAAEFFTELGDLELVGAVASHYMAAHRVTDTPEAAAALAAQATTALSDAADRSARLHSHAQALSMIEQALALTADSDEKPRLWQRGARSASALAKHETAVGYAYQAFDWYQEHGDSVDVAYAAALVGEELCHAYRATEAIEVLEPIVSGDVALGEPAIVTAGARLARAYLMALRDEDAAEWCDRVIGPAERLQLVPIIVDTLVTRGSALGNIGRRHEAIALLQAATRYAQDHDLPLVEMRAANNVGHLLAYDDHQGAMEACRAGLEQANRLGDVRFIGSFAWAVAAYMARDGRFEEAQALRDEVRDRIELPADNQVWYELTDLMARVERGDASAVEPALEAVRRSRDDANPQSQASEPLTRAVVNLYSGRLAEAYTDAMSVDATHRFPDHLEAALFAAALLGDVAKVERVAAGLESSLTRGRMVDALRSAVTGVMAALHGRTDAAVAAFTQALGFRFLRLQRASYQALFATLVGRDVAEARAASDAAYEVFTEVGALAYLELFAAGMPPVEEQQAAGS